MNEQESPLVRAQQLDKKGQFALAAEQYEEAIKLGIGDQALAHEGKGRVLAGLGRFEEAIVECQQALKLNPKLPLAHAILGYISHKQAAYDLAEEALLKAIQLDPEGIIGLEQLANLYADQKRYSEAIALLEKYVQLRPKHAQVRLTLANLYIAQSNISLAINQINTVFKMKPIEWKLYLLCLFHYYVALLHYMGQSKLFITGLLLGLGTIALLAPLTLSVPLGVLISIFFSPFIFFPLWSIANKNVRALVLIVAPTFGCAIYWFLVWLHSMF